MSAFFDPRPEAQGPRSEVQERRLDAPVDVPVVELCLRLAVWEQGA